MAWFGEKIMELCMPEKTVSFNMVRCLGLLDHTAHYCFSWCINDEYYTNGLCYAHVITGTVNGSAQYDLSKAVIITFYSNNHIDKEQNKPTEQWEAA